MVENAAFCKYLASSLCALNLEFVRQMCPKAAELRESIEEIRDTNHPGLITEGLMTQLLAFGEHNAHKSFEKHVRDEVNFGDGTLPWRRSPLWFVIKVAMQTILYRAFSDWGGRLEYKNFMIYFMAEIGFLARDLEICDVAGVLAVVQAKVAHRVYKMSEKTLVVVLDRVADLNKAVSERLQELHEKGRESALQTIPSGFGPVRETDLATSLKNSADYLRDAMMHKPTTNSPPNFNRTHRKRNQRQKNGLPKLEDGSKVSLLDFEAWVDNQLQRWLQGCLQTWYEGEQESRQQNRRSKFEKICCDLAALMGKYLDLANARYAQIPDAMSLMMLVTMELWVALDKLCILHCELLQDFSPEIPKNFINPLLLPYRRQIDRAEKVEEHIVSRQPQEKLHPGIFADPGPNTFAVKFYDQNLRHRTLRQKIEDFALQERDDRRKLWEERSVKYQELRGESLDMCHDTHRTEWGHEYHEPTCERCRLERQAANLHIEVHEWPIPEDEDIVKNVVFELNCPPWFAQFRDITWRIMDDYGRPQARERSKMEMGLLEYPATKQFASSTEQRLSLASSTKSWINTHYKKQSFPVDFTSIAKPNTLNFCLWDGEKGARTAGRLKSKPNIKHLCVLDVNATEYSHLQYAVESYGHGQNAVLADQRNCHSAITLHEMSAFGLLRSGERLQWYNITRELISPSISMNKMSVHTLICQAAWELGSSIPDKKHRESHIFFQEHSSVQRLLHSLEYRLERIRANWNEHCTMHTLAVLGVRALSLCPTSLVERTASFIRLCREVSMEWCTSLSQTTSANPQSGPDCTDRLALLFKVAGVCLLTFAVEKEHLPRLLRSEEDFQHLVRSSILFFENTPQPIEDHNLETKTMIFQIRRVLCHAEQQVSELIEQESPAFNNAVQQTAEHIHISTPWCFDEGDNKRWATNKTISTLASRAQEVRYNILSGELLIDNQPPGRLPLDYTNNPLFQRIFGQVMRNSVWNLLTG